MTDKLELTSLNERSPTPGHPPQTTTPRIPSPQIPPSPPHHQAAITPRISSSNQSTTTTPRIPPRQENPPQPSPHQENPPQIPPHPENPPTEVENTPTEDENPPTEDENPPTEDENPPTEVENPPTEVENPPTEVENPPPSEAQVGFPQLEIFKIVLEIVIVTCMISCGVQLFVRSDLLLQEPICHSWATENNLVVANTPMTTLPPITMSITPVIVAYIFQLVIQVVVILVGIFYKTPSLWCHVLTALSFIGVMLTSIILRFLSRKEYTTPLDRLKESATWMPLIIERLPMFALARDAICRKSVSNKRDIIILLLESIDSGDAIAKNNVSAWMGASRIRIADIYDKMNSDQRKIFEDNLTRSIEEQHLAQKNFLEYCTVLPEKYQQDLVDSAMGKKIQKYRLQYLCWAPIFGLVVGLLCSIIMFVKNNALDIAIPAAVFFGIGVVAMLVRLLITHKFSSALSSISTWTERIFSE